MDGFVDRHIGAGPDAFVVRSDASLSTGPRYPSIDIARGLIMVLMAIDHVSVYWNEWKRSPKLEGLPGLPVIEYGDWAQQLTREITHICAPGFEFLAGMGAAIMVVRRQRRGDSSWSIDRDLLVRGLLLCLCEFVLLFVAYGMAPMTFVVLACIGCNMMIFALARRLPTALMAALSAAAILTVPFYVPDGFVVADAWHYFRNIFLYVALDGYSFLVIYPILPWIGFFGIGWCFGKAYERDGFRRGAGLSVLGLAMVTAAFLLRWFGGSYADRLPIGDGPDSAIFWAVSKYPPSPVFSISMIGAILLVLGALRSQDHRACVARWWNILSVYGRAPLFFYVVHFYLFLIYPEATGTRHQYGLCTVYSVWLAGLLVLWPLCLRYHRLRVRYPRFLKYF